MPYKDNFIQPEPDNIGDLMLSWASDLYPIRRSLTGPGVRETIKYIKNLIPGLQVHEIQSGAQVFDWVIPEEWTLRDAFISDVSGNKIVDINDHGLHIVGYSEPVDDYFSLEELKKHLHTSQDQPEIIPYVTSYYERRWGFCVSQRQYDSLKSGQYHVKIDADLKPGVLNYADFLIPGEVEDEIIFSTYICHPMMANNEVSGPVVATALARWLCDRKNYFSYRFIFVPETIGSLVYLQRHHSHMKQKTHAGFILTCIGDDRAFSFLPSRKGNTVADRAARYVLDHNLASYEKYSFLDRGSDERQYCSPLLDLPFVSVMRSKYGTYPEYHTSADDLSLITPNGLAGGLAMIQRIIKLLEINHFYKATNIGEPQLGRRGLYPNLSQKGSGQSVRAMMNLLAYADGSVDLLQIAESIEEDVFTLAECASLLAKNNLLVRNQLSL